MIVMRARDRKVGLIERIPLSYEDPLGLYLALEVMLPNGTTYIPLTVVKNSAQATAFGLPMGTAVAIAVPPAANPQGAVDCAKHESLQAFKKYWEDPSHNYKDVNGPMYDAYGNFLYGATGESAGIPRWLLQTVADYLHSWNNNLINTNDINSGFNAIESGGKLKIINYNPPASH